MSNWSTCYLRFDFARTLPHNPTVIRSPNSHQAGVQMFRELKVSAQEKSIHISTGAGPFGGRFDTILFLNNPSAAAEGLCDVFTFEDAITSSQISALSKENESLKKRLLLPTEIQRLVHVLRAHPVETGLN